MDRFINNYQGKEFDLIVIGGGITGASVAYEAASRGLDVALLEKSDFGSETSAATSKMIHGGLRYLSTYEFALVRESLKERRVLMNIAPNFIHPAPFLFSSYKNDKVSVNQMKLGMILYEAFSFDKNWIWDKSKKMPSYKSLSAITIEDKFPNALTENLLGGQLYYDCASHSPERFTLSFIKSAVHFGASVANYAEITDFIVEPKGRKKKIVKGVKVIDKTTGETKNINGKLVINCAGPWADIILDKVKKQHGDQELRRSEGIHFIINKVVDDTTFSAYSKSGRHFFLFPYRNHTLVGTTDKEYIGKPNNYKVTREAIEGLIEEVNSAFGKNTKIKYKDILHTYGGLRPLVEDQTEESYKSSRKYEITGEKKNGISGLITVEGGKFTTSRMLAEKAINKAIRILKYPREKSISQNTQLYGCKIKNLANYIINKQEEYKNYDKGQIEYLIKSYGTEIDTIISLAKEDEQLNEVLNADGELMAQVKFAIQNEMAISLSDIIFRRTGVGLLGNPGNSIINKVAKLAANELKWDKDKLIEEIKMVEKTFEIPS
ncbi:MAG: glycerol-3-phosphate dehydrogenase/oxidase [Bacteroidales bacterium]|nr:glycerol-3-phosphate dehydrogenase/oxidase [Bacteroidales bacterium]